MKIMILSAAKSIHTVKWANAMVAKNHEVYLVYNRGHEASEDNLDANIKQIVLKYSGVAGYYLNARQFSKVVKTVEPDVINVHYASGYGTLARRAHVRPPVLLSVWGSDVYDFPYENIFKKIILKKNVRFATRLASTSECMANQLRQVMNDNDMVIDITPFGVDLTLFNPNSYPRSESHGEIVIGNIKTLEPKYGVDKLIYAVDMLRHKLYKDENWNETIVLKIYGSGSQKEQLLDLAEDLDMKEIVKFEGRIPNVKVPKALSGIDIFCATSQLNSESFGVAIVEAMAMKVPVVVSDVDGFKEVVKNNETGIVVSKSDVETIAAALEELIRDKEKRLSYGNAGRLRVETLYDWKKNVDSMEKIYLSMIRKG